MIPCTGVGLRNARWPCEREGKGCGLVCSLSDEQEGVFSNNNHADTCATQLCLVLKQLPVTPMPCKCVAAMVFFVCASGLEMGCSGFDGSGFFRCPHTGVGGREGDPVVRQATGPSERVSRA